MKNCRLLTRNRIRTQLLLLLLLALAGGSLFPATALTTAGALSASSGIAAENARSSGSIRALSLGRRVTAIAASDETKESVDRETSHTPVRRRMSVPVLLSAVFTSTGFKHNHALKAQLPRLTLPVNRAVIINFIHDQDGLK